MSLFSYTSTGDNVDCAESIAAIVIKGFCQQLFEIKIWKNNNRIVMPFGVRIAYRSAINRFIYVRPLVPKCI